MEQWSKALSDLINHLLAGLGLPDFVGVIIAFVIGGLILASIGPVLALVLIWLLRKSSAVCKTVSVPIEWVPLVCYKPSPTR